MTWFLSAYAGCRPPAILGAFGVCGAFAATAAWLLVRAANAAHKRVAWRWHSVYAAAAHTFAAARAIATSLGANFFGIISTWENWFRLACYSAYCAWRSRGRCSLAVILTRACRCRQAGGSPMLRMLFFLFRVWAVNALGILGVPFMYYRHVGRTSVRR